jgi:hypothetical protein
MTEEQYVFVRPAQVFFGAQDIVPFEIDQCVMAYPVADVGTENAQ